MQRYSQFPGIEVTKVSRCLGHISVSFRQKVLFFSCCKAVCREVRATVTIDRRMPIILCSARIDQLSCRANVADGASGKGEPSDKVCEVAAAPASFRSAAWMRFGFPVSRNEKGDKKVTVRTRLD